MGIMTNVAGISPKLHAGAIPQRSAGREISRLITAAVVNQGFCKMLLRNPRMALASGYKGETFTFETEEQDYIFSIEASNLAEFANQLAKHNLGATKKNGNGHRPTM